MIGAELGAGGAPPVGISTTWPSAAATAGILSQPLAPMRFGKDFFG